MQVFGEVSKSKNNLNAISPKHARSASLGEINLLKQKQGACPSTAEGNWWDWVSLGTLAGSLGWDSLVPAEICTMLRAVRQVH